MHFTLRLATGGKNEQIARHTLWNRKLSFPNGGRRNRRNYFEKEGIGTMPTEKHAFFGKEVLMQSLTWRNGA